MNDLSKYILYLFRLIRSFLPALGIAAAVPFLCACSVSAASGGTAAAPGTGKKDGADTELTVLTIGTADSGGSMYPAGQAIARLIEAESGQIHVNLSASTGSYTNISQLADGQIDLGLVSGDAAYSACNGTLDFTGNPQTGLTAVCAVYSSVSNWMALDASSLSYVHDLKGKSLSVGPQDSITDLSARIVLDLFGISADNTRMETRGGIGFGAQQVLLGKLDAVHGFAGIPVEGLSELASRAPAHLLAYTPEELSHILGENSFYYRTKIPAGTYEGQEEDVESFGVKCLLCVDSSMDEELVYRLTSILYSGRFLLSENQAVLTPMAEDGFMYGELPIPLHPGAERFYREQGLIP